jgi:FKBP-type peptidyl-prolyl cis-trans isomerase FkpA
MKPIQYKSVLQLLVVLALATGCSNSSSSQEQDERAQAQASSGEMETASGISYQFVKHGTGEVPPDGGYWMMNLAYYDEDGKLLFSTEDQGGAMPVNHMPETYTKNASFEECFGLIGDGDSAVFYVSADSLFKNTYGRPVPPDLTGTRIKLCLGIEKIFSPEQYVDYTQALAKVQMDKEAETIRQYLNENNINAEVTEEGLYYQVTQMGTGAKPNVGQNVKVNYTGALLDGTIFDTSVEEAAKAANIYNPQRQYQPFQFPLGTGNVIKGWDIGIGLLPEGSKATLVIPSPLAYGSRGAGALIKANSILVFDVELVEIVD